MFKNILPFFAIILFASSMCNARGVYDEDERTPTKFTISSGPYAEYLKRLHAKGEIRGFKFDPSTLEIKLDHYPSLFDIYPLKDTFSEAPYTIFVPTEGSYLGRV